MSTVVRVSVLHRLSSRYLSPWVMLALASAGALAVLAWGLRWHLASRLDAEAARGAPLQATLATLSSAGASAPEAWHAWRPATPPVRLLEVLVQSTHANGVALTQSSLSTPNPQQAGEAPLSALEATLEGAYVPCRHALAEALDRTHGVVVETLAVHAAAGRDGVQVQVRFVMPVTMPPDWDREASGPATDGTDARRAP